MIQCDNLSISFAGHSLFEKVSFVLDDRDRCGLVGRNGSGKSTLLKLITKEIEKDQGEIQISKGCRLGYLQQHIAFTKNTVLAEAALALLKDELSYKAEKVLFGLGFTEETVRKNPQDLSGGYQLRLHLAKVLIQEPDCLLLDEPTNYLDIVSMRWLKNVLRRWKGSFLLISHDREFLDSVTTHTMGIHRGELKKVKGSSLDYYQRVIFDEEVYEKTRERLEKKREHMQSYIERFGAKATKAKQAQSRMKRLEKEPIFEKLNAISHLQFRFHEIDFPGKKMLEVRNLTFSYTDKPMIKKLSIEVGRRSRIAIIGKNGLGKSTSLKLLAGELEQSNGTRKVSINTHMGYFGQTNIDRMYLDNTVVDEIHAANPMLKLGEVKGICGLMLFSGDHAEKKIRMLSGGERSRVLLGKILAKPCNLLLLDEPTHHLDIESVEALLDAIDEFSGSIIMVTHSELILRRIPFDQIVVCEENGQRVLHGSYEDFLEKIGWVEEKKGKENRQNKSSHLEERRARGRQKKEIARIEEKITALENEQKQIETLIEEGSFAQSLLEDYGTIKKEIEELYSKLENLYDDL